MANTTTTRNGIVMPEITRISGFSIFALPADMTSKEVELLIQKLCLLETAISEIPELVKKGIVMRAKTLKAIHVVFTKKFKTTSRPYFGEEEHEAAIHVTNDSYEFPAPSKEGRWLKGSLVVCK